MYPKKIENLKDKYLTEAPDIDKDKLKVLKKY